MYWIISKSPSDISCENHSGSDDNKTEIAPSKSQARTLITQNSISLNDNKITDCNYTLSEKDFVEGYAILKKGKKVFHKLEK